jgi:cytochrome c oxidase subunit 3
MIPTLATIALLFLMYGLSSWMNGGTNVVFYLGLVALIAVVWRWFSVVINESVSGKYNAQVDRTFRQSMAWFIFSEVFFFAAFFGALFYARHYSVGWIGGLSAEKYHTHELLYPTFEAIWPTNGPENMGGDFKAMGPWPLPTINTLILLTSGVTLTWAHWGMAKGDRVQLSKGLLVTVILGFIFLCCQAYEYYEAYAHLGLTLGTGIYGSTFFMMTGFHGLHVLLGTVMLLVVYLRVLKGHFSHENHFAFEAAAWYWHFVDVVWLLLYLFVYII